MNQIVVVAKIAGEGSRVVQEAFARWAEARRPNDEETTLVESSQWPSACRDEMRQLCTRLKQHAACPAVVFFNEHADRWSMFHDFEGGFPAGDKLLYACQADDEALFCYPLPDGGALRDHLRVLLRRRRLTGEMRWFYRVLAEAESAGDWLMGRAAIVVARQVVGGLVEDEEIEAATQVVPEWLQMLITTPSADRPAADLDPGRRA